MSDEYPKVGGKFVVAAADKPTANGRTYSRACLEKAVTDAQALIGAGKFFAYSHSYDYPPNPADIAARVDTLNLNEDGTLSADIAVLAQLPKGALVREWMLNSPGVAYRMLGTGLLDGAGNVTDFKLDGLVAVPSPEAPPL